MRTAEEIIQDVIVKSKVHSLDPFEVFENMTKAAEIAIREAQIEAINECIQIHFKDRTGKEPVIVELAMSLLIDKAK
jgi:hypothetical protein